MAVDQGQCGAGDGVPAWNTGRSRDSCVTTEKFPMKSEEQAETCSRSFAFTLNIMGLFNVLRWGVIGHRFS